MITLRRLLLLLLLLPCLRGRAQSTDAHLNDLAAKWRNAAQYALTVAALLPEAALHFRPTPEEMTFKQQLLHTAANMRWLSSTYLGAAPLPAPADTAAMDKAALLRYLSAAYGAAASAHSINPAMLRDTVAFFAGPLPRRRILYLLHDHQAHHIGQLIVYLRLLGIRPPDYVGW